jgi:hypothetical protein
MTMQGAVQSFLENVCRSQSTRAAARLIYLLTIPPCIPERDHVRPVKLGGNG